MADMGLNLSTVNMFWGVLFQPFNSFRFYLSLSNILPILNTSGF